MSSESLPRPGTWTTHQLDFVAEADLSNPYVDVEFWLEFAHEDGTTLRRPGFWSGGRSFAARFAAAGKAGRWTWRSVSSPQVPGLDGLAGAFEVLDVPAENRFHRHGFWSMSAGRRSLVHADGRSAIIAADTAWALPWRATPNQVREYATDRHDKGFNAVLLMSMQPDIDTEGPRSRHEDLGFDVGFEDMREGRLQRLNPDYYRVLDELLDILTSHEIVPVLQPVFFGYGWKGRRVAGPRVPPADYARYCRYLVARYGAAPVMYLVGADGTGHEPQVEAGGREVEAWDCYGQPTGIHYGPNSTAEAHQDAAWLDFQWCQTGHEGEHIPERVAVMQTHVPVRAVANGEPTYEQTGRTDKAIGWWQGHEAWSNLCAGGTMGVVYGAGSLWQWILRPGEPDHGEFFTAPGASWREALHFEGSRYVGLLQRILDGLPTTDMTPMWDRALSTRGVGVPGRVHILYLEANRVLRLPDASKLPRRYTVIDPRDGKVLGSGDVPTVGDGTPFAAITIDEGDGPKVVIFTDDGYPAT
jgi:hypothetical protein